MRKKSHLSLAGYIVDIVDADMIDHPLAFRFGSLEPDLVPSFITTKHRIDLTFHKLEKKINKVIDEYDKNKGMTIGLSKDLGVITHYIADYFTFPHNIEYPGTANSYAYMSGKARYKDHDEEKAKLLEEKYSSREKKIDFHVLSVQSVQEIKGIIRLLKVMLEKENSNWDKVKEQNDEYKAENGFTDRKIKAYDKLELTDEQQKVLDALRQNCMEETLWSAIAAFQNYPFRTASGLPYQYKLKIGKDGTYNKELLIDRRENSKTLSWSSIKMAFQNCRQISGIVKRPKALGDIRGISYIYPLFWKFGLIEVPEETAKKMSGECDTEAEL